MHAWLSNPYLGILHFLMSSLSQRKRRNKVLQLRKLLLLETITVGKKVYVREAVGVLINIQDFNQKLYSKNQKTPKNDLARF